jgi:photosystem II stability/assembly factor-like uncharacterized protein
MKKNLLFILAISICFSVFYGCDTNDPIKNVNEPTENGALIMHTTDGGVSWNKHIVPGQNVIYNIAVLTPQIEQVSILAYEGLTNRMHILRSNYYGENFEIAYSAAYGLYNMISTFAYGKGFAFGSGMILMTTSNGHSWSENQFVNSFWETADFSDELHGIVLAVGWDDSNAVTTDGGVTWKFCSPINSGQDMYDIKLLDSVTAISCGKNGSLYKTTDAGISWQPVTNPATSVLQCIGFFGDVGIIGTDDSTMLRTSDRGLSWGTINSGASHVLQVFLDASAYWAAGNNYISKSTDQGLTWSIIYTKTDEYFYDMYFSKDEGYAVGQRYVK